jgi:hypothetical protein
VFVSSVQSLKQDRVGYRMITPYGQVIPLSDADLKNARADDKDPIVQDAYQRQIESLAKRGIHLDVVMPGKAGTLIALCTAEKGEEILDAAFGISKYERPARSVAVISPKSQIDMTTAFDFAASGRFTAPPMAANFNAAVANPGATRPALGQDGMHLAA